MPEADTFEAPQGGTFHGALLQAITEAFVGNGIQNDGDAEVTVDENEDLVIDVASAEGLRYGGESYDVDSDSFEIEEGPDSTTNGEDDRRVDLVYFDSDAEEYAIEEGSPDPNPTPPDTPDDGLLLALVFVAHESTNITDDDVLNWRAHAAVDFQVETQEIADEVITSDKFAKLEYGFSGEDDAGEFGALFDFEVDGYASSGSEQSYTLAIDGNDVFKIYAEADGDGDVENLRVEVFEEFRAEDDIIVYGDVEDDDGTTIYDSEEDEVPQARLGGPSSELNAYPLELANDVDRDLDGEDLTDGEDVVYDASEGFVRRDAIDVRRNATTIDDTDSPYTSNGNEVIFVDTTEGEVTIELASDDVDDSDSARSIVAIDVGGEAGANPITIETEGSETIDGEDRIRIRTDYGGTQFIEDGSNWITTGGETTDVTQQIEAAESGAVSDGAQGVLIVDHLEDGETIEIYKAVFLLVTGEAAPKDLDFVIATLDNEGGYTERETIYEGDGEAVYDGAGNSRGDPLVSWENDTGSDYTIAVLIDNDTGDSVDVIAKVTGARVS